MRKDFTQDDLKELADRLSPILDDLAEFKKKEDIEETMRLNLWKDGEIWVETSHPKREWRLIKAGDDLKFEITTKEEVKKKEA